MKKRFSKSVIGTVVIFAIIHPRPGVAAASKVSRAPLGTVRLASFAFLDPTCAYIGDPSINLVSGPIGGRVEIRKTRDYPNFPTSNVRVRCDLRRVPMVELLYRPMSGFRGVDEVVVEVVSPRGELRRYRRRILVR